MRISHMQCPKINKKFTIKGFSRHSSRLLKYPYLLLLILTIVIFIFLHILAFLRRHILILKHK